MERRTRKHLKWSVIAIASILTMVGIFSGDIYCVIGVVPLFWIYVFLDKYKNVTKKAQLHKLYKDDE